MSDKAEMLINRLIEAAEFGRVVLINGGVEKQELDAARRDLVALITSQAVEIDQLRATLITIVHQSNDWSEAIHKELASLGIQVEPRRGYD